MPTIRGFALAVTGIFMTGMMLFSCQSQRKEKAQKEGKKGPSKEEKRATLDSIKTARDSLIMDVAHLEADIIGHRKKVSKEVADQVHYLESELDNLNYKIEKLESNTGTWKNVKKDVNKSMKSTREVYKELSVAYDSIKSDHGGDHGHGGH